MLFATLAGSALSSLRVETESRVAGAENRPSLVLPLVCEIGETCWVVNYVDVDPSRGVRDFKCKGRSYDGHDGVDFAIRDLGVMARGVAVVASAAGLVKTIRNQMEDVAIGDEASRARIKGRECGNGVVIEHTGGWQTQYCHLLKGSVHVRPGQRVVTGAPIGLVGLSGDTSFPHVHMVTRYNGEAVDPYTGHPVTAGCGKEERPLWRSDLNVPYESVALYNAGFAAGRPDLAAIRNGERPAEPFPLDAPALVLWIDMFGVEAGDRLQFRIARPDGRALLEREQEIERTQARRFAYMGIQRAGDAWIAGTYTGEVTHVRMVEGQPATKKITRTIAIQ